MKKTGTKAIAAAAVGNALEWYDFSVYALFAMYIAPTIFAAQDRVSGTIAAFIVFGVGFIARPVGAIVLGAYGDRAGRRAALTASLSVMALGTLCIAVAPPYAAIGIGAPLLILAGRVLQGLSAGGEMGGAVSFLVEHAPPERRGVYAAWLQSSMAISNILGAIVATTLSLVLAPEELAAWGWRVPFVLGLAIVPVGLWLRRGVADTPEFEQVRKVAAAGSFFLPLHLVLARHARALLLSAGISIIWVVAVYALVIYMPTFMQRSLGFTAPQAFIAALIGNIFMAVGCLGAGWLADRFGRVRVVAAGALVLLVAVLPVLSWVAGVRRVEALVIAQIVFCLAVALFAGSAPALIAELFPTDVRSTGVSLGYNFAATIFGGFAPAVLTWLTERMATQMAPAYYVMGAAVVSLLALAAVPHRRHA